MNIPGDDRTSIALLSHLREQFQASRADGQCCEKATVCGVLHVMTKAQLNIA